MAENKTTPAKDEGSEKKKKFLIIIIIFLAVIVALLGVAVVFILNGNSEKAPGNEPAATYKYLGDDGKLKYDEGAIVLDPDELQQKLDEMIKKVEDGYISISHKNQAISHDGEYFECFIQNGIENKYDMFINIYKDNTAEEQLLLTGLIPPGQGIDHFRSEIKLKPGNYEALLVITQVEDDHETLRDNQLFLALHLTVT